MLGILGKLSKLFSENLEPYLHYRIAENLFCKSFSADNLSRSDTSADAALNGLGFGIKTFLGGNGKKFEKVAEFGRNSSYFKNMNVENKIQEIIRLRNERIETTKKIYALNNIIYHCVTRTRSVISITEETMNLIDCNSLKIEGEKSNTILFSDNKEEYNFSISKNTLFKRFNINDILEEIPVEIIDDPFALLEGIFGHSPEPTKDIIFATIKTKMHVFLPLYSTRSRIDKKNVPVKSGLNQWNAEGRPRKLGEVYIPIPSAIHKNYEKFFPPRDIIFNLHLPNKKMLRAKVCQENGKALMTNPNEDLGLWILRDVLNLKEGELLTYDKLEDIGLDSVVIYKIDNDNYEIDFAKIDSYEKFIGKDEP